VTDDELMELLRASAADVDPVPPEVLASASAAFATRRLDEELAELIADSALTGAGAVRAGAEDVRLLSFESGRVTVELQLDYAASPPVLRGLITGGSATVTVERPGDARSVPVDESGWFTVTDPPRGATRLRFHAVDGQEIVTSWTHL
jgi:hypothetical protein